MKTKTLGALLAFSFFTFSSCGGVDVSCDFRTAKPQGTGSSNGPESMCQEYSNYNPLAVDATFKLGCDTSTGAFARTLCPKANIVGGCDLGKAIDGSHPIDWYYSDGPTPKTFASLAGLCGGSEKVLQPR